MHNTWLCSHKAWLCSHGFAASAVSAQNSFHTETEMSQEHHASRAGGRCMFPSKKLILTIIMCCKKGDLIGANKRF